ncbi:hypothetical protein QUA30_20130 [Microcoleus sp. Pol14C2]|uniref:hypothetical protein n=1 Tax=unclassified Microcoleus TaxID=2642155 RepID=UPI002FCE6B67
MDVEGSSATDSVTDVTDVTDRRKKEEGRSKREKFLSLDRWCAVTIKSHLSQVLILQRAITNN